MHPAAWVRQVTGADPAAAWRGRYRDHAGALRLIRDGGGLVVMFSRALASVGARVTRLGEAGCVAVVERIGAPGGLVGAVGLGDDMWETPSREGGVLCFRSRAVMAWTVV